MTEISMEDGTRLAEIKRIGENVEARLERTFDHDRAIVWRMLTEPSGLAQWLAPGTIELRIGGRVHIDFGDSGQTIESSVRQLDPPRLLEYSWSSGEEVDRPLRWELTAFEGSTRLSLNVKLPASEDIAKACAGFDAHLEMLAAALEGVPIRFPLDHFLKARRLYGEHKPE